MQVARHIHAKRRTERPVWSFRLLNRFNERLGRAALLDGNLTQPKPKLIFKPDRCATIADIYCSGFNASHQKLHARGSRARAEPRRMFCCCRQLRVHAVSHANPPPPVQHTGGSVARANALHHLRDEDLSDLARLRMGPELPRRGSMTYGVDPTTIGRLQGPFVVAKQRIHSAPSLNKFTALPSATVAVPWQTSAMEKSRSAIGRHKRCLTCPWRKA